MMIWDVMASGAMFIYLYGLFGITELVSFQALGVFFLAYMAWVAVKVILLAFLSFLLGRLLGKSILGQSVLNQYKKADTEYNKYDDYILAEEEEDEDDDDMNIHISFD